MQSSALNPDIKKIFIILQIGFFLGLFGCSGHERSEQNRLREQNAKGEYIYRLHNEQEGALAEPQHKERDLYPWEKEK